MAVPEEQAHQEPSPPPFSPTWVPDTSSAKCLVCAAAFTFSNRRHHCRRCGTLVCQACSSNRIVLDEREAEERVCDVCFYLNLRKSETRESWEGVLRRQAALLSQGSRVTESGHCIRIYFLDGAFRSLYYDAQTTAISLASKITPLPIALFQVERVITDDAHFELIPPNDKVTDILSRWSLAGWSTAKLVVPLFSAQRGATIVPGPNLARRPSCSMDDPRLSIQSYEPGLPSVTPRASFVTTSAERSSRRLSDSQAAQVEVLQLRQTNEELRERCEVLARQCRRLGGLFPSKDSGGADAGADASAPATPGSSSTSATLLLRSSLSNTTEVDQAGQTVEFLDDDSMSKGPPSPTPSMPQVVEPSSQGEGGGGKDMRGRKQPDAQRARYRVLLQGWLKKQSDFRRVWKHRLCMLCTDGFLRYNGTDGRTLRGAIPLRRVVLLTRSLAGLDLILVIAGGKRLRLRAHAPDEFMQWFEAIQQALSSLGTGRHSAVGGQVDDEDDPRHSAFIIEESAGGRLTVTGLLRELQALDDLLTQWDFRLLDTILDKGRSDVGWFLSAQELVAKVDSLFAKVLELGPDWYARFQAWAIRCLRSSVSLPVKDAAMLRAVLNCLASEGLLAHPDTTEALRAVIHSQLRRRKAPQLSPAIAAVRRSMSDDGTAEHPVQLAWSRCQAIEKLLRAVAEHWVPLFPPDMGLALVLESEVKAAIENDVQRPFQRDRAAFSVEDLLRLRDWADSLGKRALQDLQSKELAALLDNVSKAFAQESLARLQAQADTWIARTLESLDMRGVSTGEARRAPTLGWATELGSLLEQQFQAAATRPSAPDRAAASGVIIGVLSPLRARLAERLRALARPDSLDWTCAVLNDYAAFADTLTSLSKRYLEQPGDAQLAAVADAARQEVLEFSQVCQESTRALAVMVGRDINRCLSGLPEAWAQNAASPLPDLDALVQRFMEQARAKLARTTRRDAHLRLLLNAIMDTITKSYLETLARAAGRFRQDEDQVFSQRLQRDVKALSAAFLRFDETLAPHSGGQEGQPVLHERVRPLLKTVALLEIDPLEVRAFMQRTLVPLFGDVAPVLVRNVMLARDSSLTTGQKAAIEDCLKGRVADKSQAAQIGLEL